MRWVQIARRSALIGLAAFVGACSGSIPAPDATREAEARKAYDMIRSGDDAGLEARMPADQRTPELRGQIAEVRKALPKGEPKSVKTIQWRASSSPDGAAAYESTDRYDYADGVVIVKTRLVRAPAKTAFQVMGLHADVLTPEEAKAAEAPVLQGKGPMHWAVILAAAASLLTCLAGAITALFRKGVRGRWLWVLFSLLGVGKLAFDWSAGTFTFETMNLNILGVAFLRGASPLDPWILSVGFPLGALLFFSKSKAHRAHARALATARTHREAA